MVCVSKTYGLEGREEAWRNEKASNRLTDNGLETLRKYGRISEKIFCGREFLKINWVLLTKKVYIEKNSFRRCEQKKQGCVIVFEKK